MEKQYLVLDKVQGPLIILSDVEGVSYDEIVEIEVKNGGRRKGKVVQLYEDKAIIQVFEPTTGISLHNTIISFTGKPLQISLSKDILGREFNGIGEAIDGSGDIYSAKKYNINGMPMNPVARKYPRNFIQTGISSIDCLTTLIRGQKLPIFSGNGIPHNELAAQIVKQAKISDNSDEKFAVVFAAMGIKHDDADFFRKSFEEAGVLERVVMYTNLADDPIVERIITPRCALTAAEYLAFEEGMHILVIMTDMTNYCEALRELSSSREEVPSRKGYPGYLYSDLASLYERAGMMDKKEGSITQIPILTMPNDDITHPIPDLTGYITEGQIVLSRSIYGKNIYPPVNILPSLSRLMKDGIGEGFTRGDHSEVSNQVFSSYSYVQDVIALAQVIGEDELSSIDKIYMKFGREFENRFLNQGFDENRDINETLNLAWEILSILPKSELDRVNPDILDKYYRGDS
ncbi:V/A-type H+-transporting ATPase subunit B [Clostridium tetanomorphum]|uniref:V-type ATP synthase beta chain n=1 Tax=Clostridium tetanomorphum TaxID=1553 RepID=A0A923J2A5_CLOTT|nr:V-type ATP synthase subunit B [Clostridium tetanomorphum]KAJ50482.1 V-type ATP synthase subunit B [Clostridium tetanomorphum DSM 665]MBC2398273.1 V-type ATP synthase subunit B [Clostridium tetanomorphum]MBP1865610.1 V/A-type H+-transporting ATPase subunit B [Clostridium tetanomorphum]NRS85884.1 V/A-type H+-transporting ATPase subunit B [Clostridium tetanomorphum]NRZ96106.1 V/A-type H+-transporting ATPase subunit B [Clostridium tetanomorphum]